MKVEGIGLLRLPVSYLCCIFLGESESRWRGNGVRIYGLQKEGPTSSEREINESQHSQRKNNAEKSLINHQTREKKKK